jgi:TonB family protein
MIGISAGIVPGDQLLEAQMLQAIAGQMRIIIGMLAFVIAAATAVTEFTPARRVSGEPPPPPSPMAVGWLEETIDLTVDAGGRVRDVTALHGTAPSPNLLGPVAAMWRFRPATDGNRPVSSHVLGVALFRPPQLYDQPAFGSPSTDFASASQEVPSPTVEHRPRYPPLATGDSVVLVEVLIGVDGRVRAAAVVEGADGFGEEALLAAREWIFRPAHHNGQFVSAYAYIAFGFRQPVTRD